MFLRNIGIYIQVDTALWPKTPISTVIETICFLAFMLDKERWANKQIIGWTCPILLWIFQDWGVGGSYEKLFPDFFEQADEQYSIREQIVCFACVTSLRVKGRQTHFLCKPDITDIGTKTARYKVLPLGNNVYIVDSICSLTWYPSHPSDHLPSYF
jgi:hypothetical protein